LVSQFPEGDYTGTFSFEQQIENVFELMLHGANLPAEVLQRKARAERTN
jgi:hypothetical protein